MGALRGPFPTHVDQLARDRLRRRYWRDVLCFGLLKEPRCHEDGVDLGILPHPLGFLFALGLDLSGKRPLGPDLLSFCLPRIVGWCSPRAPLEVATPIRHHSNAGLGFAHLLESSGDLSWSHRLDRFEVRLLGVMVGFLVARRCRFRWRSQAYASVDVIPLAAHQHLPCSRVVARLTSSFLSGSFRMSDVLSTCFWISAQAVTGGPPFSRIYVRFTVSVYLYSVGHYPNTALNTQKNKNKKIEQGSGLSSLGR